MTSKLLNHGTVTKGHLTKKFVGKHTLLYPEKNLRLDLHSQLQAQKGVPRLGLEPFLITLEHLLLNTFCWGCQKELFMFYEFSDQTPTWGSRLKKVLPK